MKTKGKAWQLVVTALLIVVFVYTAFLAWRQNYGDVTTTYIKGAKGYPLWCGYQRRRQRHLCALGWL